AEGDDGRLEEYRRLFYVAATRAEETLTICGGNPDDKPDTWYALASRAFAQLSGSEHYTEKAVETGGSIRRYARSGTIKPEKHATVSPSGVVAVPSWIHAAALEEVKDPILFPSALSGREWQDGSDQDNPTATRARAKTRGLLVHKLLELLPDRDRATWPDIATAVASRFALEVDERDALVDSVLGLLDDPSVADLFVAGGLAEVSVQGMVNGAMVSGQIDRLLISDHQITILEYKSSARVPVQPSAVPEAHRQQVAAYRALIDNKFPGRAIRTVLLYTAGPVAYDVG
ncbi:MAG: PD-(D/E)XK nuclease family protein, partial [Pseudomonadota bacterium]